MRHQIKSLILLLSIYPASSFASSWGYSNINGPEQWGDLDSSYLFCKIGKNQTPIDLHNTIDASLDKIEFLYQPTQGKMENRGFTLQCNVETDDRIKISDHEYKLVQVHFHNPSEHSIENKSFPLEGHFVHMNDNGDLAVVGVMFVEGEANSVLEKFLSAAPTDSSKPQIDIKGIDLSLLMPEDKDYFLYSGSLTTPPCSEGVRWMVLKDSISASTEQLAKLKSIMGQNNRPLQKLNARFVLE